MKREQSLFRSTFAAPARALWDWHARPGAFERLAPPWQVMEDVTQSGPLAVGATVSFRTRVGPFPMRWVAHHPEVVAPDYFRDVQVAGPFRLFEHRHTMVARPDGGSELEDRIEWQLPAAPFSAPFRGFARRELERAFAYRHRVIAHDLAAHAGSPPMKLLVTGSHGLVGAALVPFLTTGGHDVRRLVRDGGGDHDATWRPERGELDPRAFDGVDAVIHLAGDSIGEGRWTAEKKQRIRDSRVKGTRLLAETLAKTPLRPKTLVVASAVGFYGDRGDEWLDEEARLGTGFLADVCREWEGATRPASDAGMRVVHTRFGFIVSPKGGGLKQMLPPFRLGLGGKIGSGRQFMSWVALDDVLGALLHALRTESLRGAVNVVAPNPVTNAEFTKTLGAVLGRPTFFPMPAFAAHAVFGEMADELLLASQRVKPVKLLGSGFQFAFPTLDAALRHELGRKA